VTPFAKKEIQTEEILKLKEEIQISDKDLQTHLGSPYVKENETLE
jgi:hypothetical protein